MSIATKNIQLQPIRTIDQVVHTCLLKLQMARLCTTSDNKYDPTLKHQMLHTILKLHGRVRKANATIISRVTKKRDQSDLFAAKALVLLSKG